MENQNQNQLPMLPDPMEDQPVALPTTAEPTALDHPVALAKGDTSPKPKRNYLRMGLIFGGVAVALVIILFGSRIIDLLNLRGTKAATEMTLEGRGFVDTSGWQSKPGTPDGDGVIKDGPESGRFGVVPAEDGTQRLMLIAPPTGQ